MRMLRRCAWVRVVVHSSISGIAAAAPHAQQPSATPRLVTGPKAVKVDSPLAKRVSGVTPQRGRC
ncbi:MAG: hypothetical protein MK293_04710 [Pedosphaera sp.]|nr:hypothetical protein [Pedosphaera sp.]